MTAAPVSALERVFIAAKDRGRLSLVPFVTGGFPDSDQCLALMLALVDAGADAIELGVPFSDPLADGPTIQRTSQIALRGGGRVSDVFEILERFRKQRDTPVVLMSYVNPIIQEPGVVDRAVGAGANGVLLTDLPPEEMPDLWDELRFAGLATVQLVAPTTDPARLPAIAARSSGYVYCVSRTGVTGKGRAFASNLAAQLHAVRAHTSIPLLVGFGVREPADVERVAADADGVIVGTALLDDVLTAPDAATGIERAADRCRALAGALAFPSDRGTA